MAWYDNTPLVVWVTQLVAKPSQIAWRMLCGLVMWAREVEIHPIMAVNIISTDNKMAGISSNLFKCESSYDFFNTKLLTHLSSLPPPSLGNSLGDM